MEDYMDLDFANWTYAVSGTAWTTPGGDFHVSPAYTEYFENGPEDLEVDISGLVEEWIAGTKDNYGVAIKLSSSYESASLNYYTKRFFARGSQFHFYRPIIEARWDDAKKDKRGKFYASSSLAPSADNTNTLYFYNYINGQLKNIPAIGTGNIYLQMYTSASGGTLIGSTITGGHCQTGLYSASFSCSTSASYLYDRWFSSGLTTCYYTGSAITVNTIVPNEWNPEEKYVSKITNMRPQYSTAETVRFRVFTRSKNWQPNSYVIYNTTIRPTIVEDGFYSIERANDGFLAIPFGTGSTQETKMSYDISGSYFDFDMSILEENCSYKIKLAYYLNGKYEVQSEEFKFKVVL
jgi:hypothetical protein